LKEQQGKFDTWKELGPLSLSQIINNTTTQPLFTSDQIELKTYQAQNCISIGQFKKGTHLLEGIGRVEVNHGSIMEGQFSNGVMNLYGRIIFPSGNYYIGHFKNHKKHGFGKKVNSDGTIEEGKWHDDKYIGK